MKVGGSSSAGSVVACVSMVFSLLCFGQLRESKRARERASERARDRDSEIVRYREMKIDR